MVVPPGFRLRPERGKLGERPPQTGVARGMIVVFFPLGSSRFRSQHDISAARAPFPHAEAREVFIEFQGVNSTAINLSRRTLNFGSTHISWFATYALFADVKSGVGNLLSGQRFVFSIAGLIDDHGPLPGHFENERPLAVDAHKCRLGRSFRLHTQGIYLASKQLDFSALVAQHCAVRLADLDLVAEEPEVAALVADQIRPEFGIDLPRPEVDRVRDVQVGHVVLEEDVTRAARRVGKHASWAAKNDGLWRIEKDGAPGVVRLAFLLAMNADVFHFENVVISRLDAEDGIDTVAVRRENPCASAGHFADVAAYDDGVAHVIASGREKDERLAGIDGLLDRGAVVVAVVFGRARRGAEVGDDGPLGEIVRPPFFRRLFHRQTERSLAVAETSCGLAAVFTREISGRGLAGFSRRSGGEAGDNHVAGEERTVIHDGGSAGSGERGVDDYGERIAIFAFERGGASLRLPFAQKNAVAVVENSRLALADRDKVFKGHAVLSCGHANRKVEAFDSRPFYQRWPGPRAFHEDAAVAGIGGCTEGDEFDHAIIVGHVVDGHRAGISCAGIDCEIDEAIGKSLIAPASALASVVRAATEDGFGSSGIVEARGGILQADDGLVAVLAEQAHTARPPAFVICGPDGVRDKVGALGQIDKSRDVFAVLNSLRHGFLNGSRVVGDSIAFGTKFFSHIEDTGIRRKLKDRGAWLNTEYPTSTQREKKKIKWYEGSHVILNILETRRAQSLFVSLSDQCILRRSSLRTRLRTKSTA